MGPGISSPGLTLEVVRVLLLSTYELGHQPLHVASPAADLIGAGHEVQALDLALDEWTPARLQGVDAVAISVPMHTALRLAVETGRRIREVAPALPLAFYGLYAGVGHRHSVADRLIVGEYEDALVEWVDSLAGPDRSRGVSVDIGRRTFRTPVRTLLPDIGRYAHLAGPGGSTRVGYVEASRGCRHRCTHCPLPVVYNGRYRIVGVDTVLSDIAQLVAAGAGHVTFGDPDFLNAPAYSTKVIEEAHSAFPGVTFDATVKVEHILAHRSLWPRLASAGLIFVVSAVESLDPAILRRMAKGHSPADAAEAVGVVRAAGIDLHPTWLPFTPWTTTEGVADIACFIWEHDLAAVTDPVQLTIRLLIPDGSLMLEVPDLAPHLTGYDATQLGHTWKAADPEVEDLQRQLAAMAEAGDPADPIGTLAAMTGVISGKAGVEIATPLPVEARPRLTEPWFCCAEPTGAQLGALSAIRT